MLATHSSKVSYKDLLTETPASSVEAQQLQERYLDAFGHFTFTLTSETFAQRFQRLASTWQRDMHLSSSMNQLMLHPAYLAIIAMGKEALPYIFTDLQRNPDHWYIALNILTGVNPVLPQQRGNVNAMTRSWLDWGRDNGYVA